MVALILGSEQKMGDLEVCNTVLVNPWLDPWIAVGRDVTRALDHLF